MTNAPLSHLISATVDNRGRTAPTAASGIPLIATNCIKNDHLYPLKEKVRFVSREVYDSWFRAHPLPGDIIIVNKGTPGLTCLVPDPVDFCFAQDMVAIRADESKVDPTFLFAYLRSAAFLQQVNATTVGTTIPHLKKSDFGKLLVPLPDRRTQQFIGMFYLALSRRADLNSRTNETLGMMAQALFRSWFVDFDPTRARVEGRQPSGMDAETAAMFPDAFHQTKLGPAPEGWRAAALDAVAVFLNGLALQKFPPAEGATSLPVLKISHLRAGSTNGGERASAGIAPEYVVDDGDLVFSWSGSLLVRIWTGGRAALNQHLFKVSSAKFPRWYVHGWLNLHLPEFQAIAAGKATTMGHIQRHHLSAAMVLVPPPELLARLGRILAPLEELMVANEVENRTLAALRDLLLPKLLSGELRMKDAETVIAAAM
jgi:type I restriction enzyme, S subunit